jgi:hypothetical protein
MERLLSLLTLVLFGGISCQGQSTPTWVYDVVNSVITINVDEITQWEEKQKTWYGVNGSGDPSSDTATVNTLLVEGISTEGNRFIGSFPVTNQTIDPVGLRKVLFDLCVGQNGCQCCLERYEEIGCYCNTSTSPDCCIDTGGNCWCQHTRDYGG